jgi:hypothetical protein
MPTRTASTATAKLTALCSTPTIGRPGRGRHHVRCGQWQAVEPINDGTQSRVTFTLGFEGHGLGIPLVPLVRQQAQKVAPTSYRSLKKLLENDEQRS